MSGEAPLPDSDLGFHGFAKNLVGLARTKYFDGKKKFASGNDVRFSPQGEIADGERNGLLIRESGHRRG
jgi:hypothetical protein